MKKEDGTGSRSHNCWSGALLCKELSRPSETQIELEKEFSYLFEKPTNKNKNEIKYPSIKMVFPIVFKLLEISTHECLAVQIVIKRVQSLLMFSCTCLLNLMKCPD